MYWVVVIIRANLLDLLKERFAEQGIVRFTVGEVEVLTAESEGPTGDHALRVEIALNENFLEPTKQVLEVLRSEGHEIDTHVGSLSDALRIRTGETGSEAI
ncbi:MAG: hypothetical protein COB10_09990 [Planctomycetota bacterium]|nr:MAG: hypothetical protein COB10_09990 [Planctomycetota bacterium]